MKALRAIPLIALLALSLSAALIACDLTRHSIHFYYDLSDRAHMIWKVFFPSSLWVALLVIGVVTHGWRGLWILIGAPFALLWPYQFTKLLIECWLRTVPEFMCPGG